MPTSPNYVYTNKKLEAAMYPELSRTVSVRLPASVTYARGTVLGEVTATPGVYKAYASGNTDGSQNPVGVLEFDCATDATGAIFLTDTAGTQPPYAASQTSIGMIILGYYACEDLTGLDANAANKLGRIIEGSTASGLLRLS